MAHRPEKPTFRIDGASFDDLGGFYDEIGEQLLRGEPWGCSSEALHELLSGHGGALPREFRLVWEHSDLSRRRLDAVRAGSFAQLLDAIASHRNVELVLS